MSELQGACRKGSSCVHTALTLQETISQQCEGGKKVFVAYFDVSKAFDSVWIDGLFFQLYELGIRGSLWRLLYKTYKGFVCRVRIGDRMSESYQMMCGIHQGGFLSLIKYISFINSLLVQLKDSELCCTVLGIKTTPQGYADDLATCVLSGDKMGRVLTIVEDHGKTWRYSFNAGKSAIMVYGESRGESIRRRGDRMFKLGGKRVKETDYYDHVGIKACLMGDTCVRTEAKIKKARKVLNMATCLGIKRGGLNMATCCLIYWTVVIPTLCFGCEIWVLSAKDVDMLNSFQNYASKRIQRFNPRALNATSVACLGWINIVRLIKVKKMLFLRTIFLMDETNPIRQVLIQRIESSRRTIFPIDNVYASPITDLMNIGYEFGILDQIRQFASGVVQSKTAWKKAVWAAAWQLEVDEWERRVQNTNTHSLLCDVMCGPSYSVWWQVSDRDLTLVRACELMVKLLCKGSNLKSDNIRLRGSTILSRMCSLCDVGIIEDTIHVVMQCPAQADIRQELHRQIGNICPQIEHQEYFHVIMGKFIQGWDFEDMLPIWKASCQHIMRMYIRATKKVGIG